MTGAQMALIGKETIAELTGLHPETVSGLSKDEEGWHVFVDLIELKRIPEATDVLATYETVLDDEGNLIRYERTRRYTRDQLMEAA